MMLPTRSAYNSDIDCYRQSEPRLSMALSQRVSLSEHCDSSHSSRRQSSEDGSEPKPVLSHRKRVPVACERCRKRKIKCSGDEGGGQGCLNCRNAGWDGCQFLRVQSFPTCVNDLAVTNTRQWQPSARYHPYSYQAHRPPGQQQAQPTYSQGQPPYPVWAAAVECGTFPNQSQQLAWTRPQYATQYPLPYGNEASDPYAATAPPSYMLPDPEPAPHLNMTYVNLLSRPTQNTSWIDQTNNVAMTPQNGQMTDLYATVVREGQAAYTNMSIPSNGVSPSERMFPVTTAVRCLPTMSTTANDTPPMSATSHRSSLGWQTETASNASVASSHTSCSGRQEPASTFADPICSQQELSHNCSGYSRTTRLSIPSSVSGVITDEFQMNPTLDVRSPTLQSYKRRCSSRGNNSSPSTHSPLFDHNHNHNSSTLHGRRTNKSQSTKTAAATHNPGLWTTSKSLAKNTTSEACEDESTRIQAQYMRSPSLKRGNRQQS